MAPIPSRLAAAGNGANDQPEITKVTSTSTSDHVGAPLPPVSRLLARLPLSIRLGRLMSAFDAAEDAFADLSVLGGPIKRQRDRERSLRLEVKALTAERDQAREALAVVRDVVNAVLGDPAERATADLVRARRTLVCVRALTDDTAEGGPVATTADDISAVVRRDYPRPDTSDAHKPGEPREGARFVLARLADVLDHHQGEAA